MTFDEAFELVIGHEGGYTRDPKDRGNWTSGVPGVGVLKGTKYGIAAHVYPTLDIENLTVADAKIIYKRDYWDRMRADQLPEEIRFDMFDTAVNSGIGNAVRMLQRAAEVAQDGAIGPVTMGAVAKIGGPRMVARFNGARLMFLADLKSFDDFGRGWTRRVASNLLKA